MKSTDDKNCICNKEGTSQCQYCGYYFCSYHVTPSLHNCIGIDWETDEVKKQITQKDRSRWLRDTRPELVKSLSSEGVPSRLQPTALKKIHLRHGIYLGIVLVLTIAPIVVAWPLSVDNPFRRYFAAEFIPIGGGMLTGWIIFGDKRVIPLKRGNLKYVLIIILVGIFLDFLNYFNLRKNHRFYLFFVPMFLGGLVGLELWHVLKERFP